MLMHSEAITLRLSWLNPPAKRHEIEKESSYNRHGCDFRTWKFAGTSARESVRAADRIWRNERLLRERAWDPARRTHGVFSAREISENQVVPAAGPHGTARSRNRRLGATFLRLAGRIHYGTGSGTSAGNDV